MNKPNFKEAQDRKKVNIDHIDLKEDYGNSFSGKKFFLRTYGCQMNVHDSEQIRGYLENLGFIETDTLEDSDIVVLNTCAIRENAKDKVIGFLGRAKHLKKIKKDLIICLCGCLMQIPDEIEGIEKKYSYVDIVIGTHNLHELPILILNKLNLQNISVYSNSNIVYENINYSRDSSICAWINIMYGCNNFCTYCIVPYTRGREKSRKPENIIKEVNYLKNKGYKEITLLGQNVNSYGRDLNNKYLFSDLLEDVAKTGIERIRFVTSNPWNFTDELINIIAKYKNIMPYIHLPIQSGATSVLKRMNRPYTKEEYISLFNNIKNNIPNVCITTDIIVGFPNETDEEFQETLDVVNKCKFDGAYTFIYSKRAGTIASKIDDNISIETKEKRLHILNDLVNKYSLESNKKYLNSIVDVLVLGVSQKDSSKLFGYTDTFKLVNIKANKECIGNIISVKITNAKSFSLDGEQVIENN